MAIIDSNPRVLRDAILKIGADNYEKHVSAVRFITTSSDVTWTSLSPDTVVTDSTPPTFQCQIDFVQDWETEDSLSRYLWNEQGTTKAVEFVPLRGSGNFMVTANLRIKPGSIGGAVGEFATDSVTLGSDKPVFTTAPA